MNIRRTDQITFVVFTYNEAERIGRVIRNFKPFGQILIVDNYSTDVTLEIAEAEGCEILLNKNQGWVEDSITTSRVKDNVTTDWIYWAYADEMVDSQTLVEIENIIASGKYDVINILRRNYYYGKFTYDAYADRMNRVFRKEAIDFTKNKIHNFGVPTVRQERIKSLSDIYFVHHFISNTAKSYLLSIDRYTDTEAATAATEQILIKSAIRSMLRFFWNYFFCRGYKAGEAGLCLSLLSSMYSIVAAMKIYEKVNKLDRETIELRNNSVRDEILKKLGT